MKLLTYQYFWTTTDLDKVNLKILTDTVDSHEKFVDAIKALVNLKSFCRQYVSEIDLDKLGGIENLIQNLEVNNEEN